MGNKWSAWDWMRFGDTIVDMADNITDHEVSDKVVENALLPYIRAASDNADPGNWSAWDWRRFGDQVADMADKLESMGIDTESVSTILETYTAAATGTVEEKEEKHFSFDIPNAPDYCDELSEAVTEAGRAAVGVVGLVVLGLTLVAAIFKKP